MGDYSRMGGQQADLLRSLLDEDGEMLSHNMNNMSMNNMGMSSMSGMNMGNMSGMGSMGMNSNNGG
eukprot:CAMPEP_0171545230 /NCGR_PEP_ID=MMETSP0960-20121227/3951_1 /TAXON_ID=87120 /ORGANISM="Aurantiochytrium limacinum, Strain ATCCMYA-1381" /LENGTH=65 /DNA_ID=CAMNT_0012093147 /DNA_START=541 /DNA_END=734 /DNA_ORIENTATION=+